VVTALYIGLCRGEQLALRWRNVDLDSTLPMLRVRESLEQMNAALVGLGQK
jgi:hypothetical protein